jgi:prepilin-type N-terminal cleavage/methylation domain-containing protein
MIAFRSKTSKPPKPWKLGQKGFSLIELMVAMAVSAIVLAAIVGVYTTLSRSYTTQNVAADVQETLRAGMDIIAEDLMMAGLDPEKSAGARIIAGDATSIHFTSDRNMNGEIEAVDFEEINYFINGDRLMQRLYSDSSTDEVVVDNVTNFAITYLDGAEPPSELVPPLTAADLANIRSVELTLTVEQPAGRAAPVNRTYTTRVRCRNIGL